MPDPRFGLCSNCAEEKYLKTKTTRLCHACWWWHRWKGEPRPKRRYTKACLNCDAPRPLVRGRCLTCYKYYWDHDKNDRPKRLYNRADKKCRNPNCGKPLEQGQSVGGKCRACYSWCQRYGKRGHRPQKLCHNGMGWCDCGQPAEHEMVVKLGKAAATTERLLLCSSCFEYE